MSEFKYETSGPYGQLCSVCSKCDHTVWHGWYIKKYHDTIQCILCPSCYEENELKFEKSCYREDGHPSRIINDVKKLSRNVQKTKVYVCLDCGSVYSQNHCCCTF
jgi:hypothetical protein